MEKSSRVHLSEVELAELEKVQKAKSNGLSKEASTEKGSLMRFDGWYTPDELCEMEDMR